MATIKQKGDRVIVSGMLPDGSQFRKTYSKKRHGPGYKKDAQKKYEELLFENSGLTNFGNSIKARNMRKITVKELAERYVEEHLNESKAIGNRSYIDVIVSRWGGWRLDLITIGVVRPWIRSYLNGSIKQSSGKSYAATYAKKLVRYFQRLYNWGCEVEIIDRNPILHLLDHSLKKEFARKIKPRKQIITDDQFQMIISVSPLWFQRICHHSMGTGMREGEIAELRWKSIINDTIILEADETKEVDGKIIVMDPDVVDQILAIRLEQEMEKESEFVYLGENGNPVKPIQISDSWRTYRRKAGLDGENIRFHDIRRTYIDRKRRAGASKWAIANQVGHHATATTDINYSSTASIEEMRALAKNSNIGKNE